MYELESLALPFAELAAPVLTVAAMLLTALVMRSPHRPRALRSEYVDQTVAFLFSLAFGYSVSFGMAGMLSVGMNAWAAAAVVAGSIFTVGALIWFAFDFTRRLRNADAGISPFRNPRLGVSSAPTLPAGTHPQM